MSSWTPHTFRIRGEKSGLNAAYLNLLEVDGRALIAKGFPVIFTLGHLAAITNTPYGFLKDVVRRQIDPYRHFRIRKRSGGMRRIVAPHPLLLNVQKWIDEAILSHAPAHPCSTAYSTGCSPLKNAQLHSGARWLIKTDVKNFFESISERQAFHVFREFGYRGVVALELARISTRPYNSSTRYKGTTRRRWINANNIGRPFDCLKVGHLPQGAPTSPRLANLVCRVLDQKLSELATQRNCIYTRYADDIVFSSGNLTRSDAERLLRDCTATLSSYGFQRNRQKSHIVPPGAHKIVTGLTVNEMDPLLQRTLRDKIRAHLYYAKRFGPAKHCRRTKFRSILGFKSHLGGLIEYARSVNPSLGMQYQRQFLKIDWPI